MDVAPPGLPDAASRWRCRGCGNLTRFDVRRTRRTEEFWHFDLAGGHEIEQTELLAETVEAVTCRWCGRTDAIETVPVGTTAAPDRPDDVSG